MLQYIYTKRGKTRKRNNKKKKEIIKIKSLKISVTRNIIRIFQHSLSSWRKMSMSPSLTSEVFKREGPTDLVNISAVCSEEGTNFGVITPYRTFSRIK